MEITVELAGEADKAALIDLIYAQEQRWHRLDSRLRQARAREAIAMLLDGFRESASPPLVARNAGGLVRGYVAPTIREFSPKNLNDATMLEVFATRTGFAESLTLPAPDEEDAVPVATALLEALHHSWESQGVLAEVYRWPAQDAWVDGVLRAAGCEPFLYRSLRWPEPLPPTSHALPADVHIRRAVEKDADDLVALYLEESQYHHEHSPFFRMVPGLASAFRSLLWAAWESKPVEQGGPVVLVAERDGQVVGMAYTYAIRADMHQRDYVPPGCYCDIAEVGVRTDLRGQGIGRALVQGVFAAYADVQIDGYILGYSPHNPLSSRFWPHLGFHPSITLYQRRRLANGLPV